jgi:pyruvate/2-oxoacid:ferredoxin oxidoreductase alpha subunit
MQEGISYLAGSELPCVIVTVMRGGPGLGNIGPEQSDYHQVVWGGGHGNYRNIVLAPASVQEMCDLTMLAFELADRYRNPVIVATDGYIGQMVEPLETREPVTELPPRPWAVRGTTETRGNLLTSIYLDPEELEKHNQKLEAKYMAAAKVEQRFEGYRLEDAEEILIGYGIVARVLRSTVDQARERGVRAGLLRPITLWPFPVRAFENLGPQARATHVFELSNGQMLRDVQLTLGGRLPVSFYGRTGGVVPSAEELLDVLLRRLEVTENA